MYHLPVTLKQCAFSPQNMLIGFERFSEQEVNYFPKTSEPSSLFNETVVFPVRYEQDI
jgi:hypothetical protein